MSTLGGITMALFKKKIVSKDEPIAKIPGIEPSAVEALAKFGYTRTTQIKGADAEDMYYRYCIETGEVEDKCLLYQFRCAVYYSTVKKPDPKKLRWWYWKDSQTDREITDLEQLAQIYKQ